MPRPTREERLTAYHEAGHALAACLVRIAFQDVTIMPDESSLGKVTCSFARWGAFRPDVETSPRTVARAKKVIFFGLAATVSEGIAARKKIMPGNREDPHVDAALSMCARLCGSFEESVAYLTFMWEQTRNIVQLHWEGIDRLSRALIEQKVIDRRHARGLLSTRPLLPIDLL